MVVTAARFKCKPVTLALSGHVVRLAERYFGMAHHVRIEDRSRT